MLIELKYLRFENKHSAHTYENINVINKSYDENIIQPTDNYHN